MRRLAPLGLFLALGATSCITAEAECHQQALSLLGCCPFCDENCKVSDEDLRSLGCGTDVAATTPDGGAPSTSNEPESSKDPEPSEPNEPNEPTSQGSQPD
ncbi:MAG: hypothetical protein R3B09_15320 [Nannocystaceae bacterium]